MNSLGGSLNLWSTIKYCIDSILPVISNYFGEWNLTLCLFKGPEPYMEEYELGFRISDALANVGFKDISQQDYSYFESIFLATK